MLFPAQPMSTFSTTPSQEEQTTREHRYVCLDVYIQPLNTQRTLELGWVPVTRTTKPRPSEPKTPGNGIVLTDSRPEVHYSLDSRHAMSVLQNVCVTQGLQLSHLRVAVAAPDGVTNPKELPMDPLVPAGNVLIPCRLSATDGSVRCQMRVFSTVAPTSTPVDKPTINTNLASPMGAAKRIPNLRDVASEPPQYGFHSEEDVMAILHPNQPTLVEQQSVTRERVKGITDRSRLCKELRNAVPAHLKKRKNRRAVIKTLHDLEEYMGSIDPVFEECGNTPELCATAARTIGLSNTRFIELRRMWEAYQEEMHAENHEILELSPNKEACTLRKLVAILERYGWSCTSAQPRSSEDISKPPRPPSVVESPNWLGALRKRPSLNALAGHHFDSDYDSDFSPKRPRSEYASSEDGNTSDEGEVFSAPEPLITSLFEQKYPAANNDGFNDAALQQLDDTFFLPTWTPRDSSSSDIPNITFDAPDVDLFNELERQILSEFL